MKQEKKQKEKELKNQQVPQQAAQKVNACATVELAVHASIIDPINDFNY